MLAYRPRTTSERMAFPANWIRRGINSRVSREAAISFTKVKGESPRLKLDKPFGENVEGLSHCGDESYIIEAAIQKHDFEDSTLRGVIGGMEVNWQRRKAWLVRTDETTPAADVPLACDVF